VTTWRTERRFDDAAPDPWNEEPPPRRPMSPRERFSPPVPISPPVSPVVPPVQRRVPQPPAPGRPVPQPPAMRPVPARSAPPAQPPALRALPAPPALRPAPVPPPTAPRGRHGRRRAPRNRYDWRVTRHAARPVEVEDDEKHYLATFGWVAAWFAVPYALFAAWTLTFPSSPGTACARPTGNACPSPRSLALTTLIHSLPRVGFALGLALIIAGLIRLGSAAWRPATAAFSAAIIGAGAATVLYSVINSSG